MGEKKTEEAFCGTSYVEGPPDAFCSFSPQALSVPETFEPEQGGAFRSQEAPVLELGNEKELQMLGLKRLMTWSHGWRWVAGASPLNSGESWHVSIWLSLPRAGP